MTTGSTRGKCCALQLGQMRRQPAPARDQAFRLEQAERLGHGHRIDGQRLREIAHRRQLVTGLQLPAGDTAPHLRDELPVDRLGGAGDDGEEGRIRHGVAPCLCVLVM